MYNSEEIKRLLEVAYRAKELMAKHIPAELGWKFEYGESVRWLGLCDYRKRTIFLCKSYVIQNSDELVNDTILHEIAHEIAGRKHREFGHGRWWKYECVLIGAKPERCWKTESVGLVKVERRADSWEAICPGCSTRYGWRSRPHAKMKTRCWCKSCGRENGTLTIVPCL